MENYVGKTILIGNNDVLTIESVEDRMFRCTAISPKGFELKDVLCPKESCVPYKNGKQDLICLPKNKRENITENGEIKSENYKTVEALPINTDFSNFQIYIRPKGSSKEFKVIKTTKKAVHYEITDGKKYSSFENVKRIVNYNPDQEIPDIKGKSTNDFKKEDTVSTAGKKKVKKANIPAPEKKNVDKKEKKAAAKTTVSENKPDQTNVVNSGDKKYIGDIPEEIDYRKLEKNVYIDIPNKGIGLRVKYIKNGRLFWIDDKSGKYSAVATKKVKKDGLKLYEK